MPNERYQEQHVLSLCRVVSLLLVHEHRIKQYDTLNADAYFNGKVKVRNNLCGSHFCTCVWFGGWWVTP